MERTFVNGTVKDCCKDSANLAVITEESDSARGLTVKRCKVCGCRHRSLYLEPGVLGLRMTKA
jgi:hypothetical protein